MEFEKYYNWYKIDNDNFDLYGCNERFERMPEEVAKTVSDDVYWQSKEPSGGRVRFATNSQTLAVRCKMSYGLLQLFDVYRVDETTGKEYFVAGFRNDDAQHDFVKEQNLRNPNGEMRYYTLNFPLYSTVEALEIGVQNWTVLSNGKSYRNEKPVVFYGSSITKGGCTIRAGMNYIALISQRYNLNYTNMGFSGGAKAEPEMIDYLSGLEMAAFVSDYDHNAPDAEHLEKTHLKLYKAIREKHPDIPYIIITKPDYYTNPEESDRRAEVIYKTYEYAKASGDENVYFIHGKTLFGGNYYHNCTIDGSHPNEVGFMRMAEKIGPVVAKAMGFEDAEDGFDTFL